MSHMDLLEIENDPEILSFRDTFNNPIWMFMRRVILYNILSCKLLNADVLSTSRSNGMNALKYNARAVIHNLKKYLLDKSEAPILFYTASRGIIVKGEYLNQYVDDFALLDHINSVTIEHPPSNWKWINKRVNHNVIYNAPNLSIASITNKENRKNRECLEQLLEWVVYRLKDIYDISINDEERRFILESSRRNMTSMNIHAGWVLRQAIRKNVKLAIFVGSSYDRNYPIIKSMKRNNVVTVDLQHGFITRTNTVYNYANRINGLPDIVDGTPDYFLTYGKWWSTQTNRPFKKIIPVGYPFRDRNVKLLKDNRVKNKIVLLGCANNTEQYLELAEFLAHTRKNDIVVFRPHPTERTKVEAIRKKINHIGYEIDMNRDLYELLEETKIVISEISTVLFESIGIVPRQLVWRTEYSSYNLPDCPFEIFNGKEDINEIIDAKKSENGIEPDIFWSKNWQQNFTEFVNCVV